MVPLLKVDLGWQFAAALGRWHVMFSINTGGRNGWPSRVQQLYMLVIHLNHWPRWRAGPVDFNT